MPAATRPARSSLVIIAREGSISPDADAFVLRLVGAAQPGETPLPRAAVQAEAAAEEIRREFPEWLWHWVHENRATELDMLPGPVSWWWLAPISEKNPLRSRLIRDLYWVALLRRVTADGAIARVRWIGNDETIAAIAQRIVRERGITFEADVTRPRRLGGMRRAARGLKHALTQVARCLIARVLRLNDGAQEHPEVILFTKFPVLWVRDAAGWRERMYAEWPDHLQAEGCRVGYAAVLTGSASEIWSRRHEYRRIARTHRIRFLTATLTLSDLMRIYLPTGRGSRYRRWRRKVSARPVVFQGEDITPLFWRQLDEEIQHPEIASDHAIILSLRRVLADNPRARAVFYPFEYQPMERAIVAGTRAAGAVPVVGLQTGLFTANQMGFTFPRAEARLAADQPERAPVPDYLAAYGELAHEIFSARLGAARVCLSGAVRYPRLGAPDGFVAAPFLARHGLPPDARFILIGTSLAAAESLPLLRGVFGVAKDDPALFLLFKFHYHLPLHGEVEALAAETGYTRFRIFEDYLHDLMRIAPVFISGGSSTCVEAIVLGAMPVVYRSLGEMSLNPMHDVAAAAFWWHTEDELRAALCSCTTRDAAFQARRNAAEAAIRAHLFRLDAKPNERLARFLRERGVLPEATTSRGLAEGGSGGP